MTEDQGKKQDEFGLTSEGEAVGYIGLDQARVQAIEHARDNTDFYGPAFAGVRLVWEVVSREESEDYYYIKRSFRAAGRCRAERGRAPDRDDQSSSVPPALPAKCVTYAMKPPQAYTMLAHWPHACRIATVFFRITHRSLAHDPPPTHRSSPRPAVRGRDALGFARAGRVETAPIHRRLPVLEDDLRC